MLIRASLGGVLYFLSFPPFDFWFLIFPALYFFYYSLLSDEKSFLTGFIFGSVTYGVILLGIQSIGLEAWIPLTILMGLMYGCLLYTSPSPRDKRQSRMPSSA